jgi:short-chain fatty acids transporter
MPFAEMCYVRRRIARERAPTKPRRLETGCCETVPKLGLTVCRCPVEVAGLLCPVRLKNMPRERTSVGEGYFSRLGSRLSDWCERWFPDAFIFALLAAILVFIAGLCLGSSPVQLVAWFGGEFWKLVPFTMQMVFIVVGGYVVACSPPVYRLISALARVPRTPRGAVAFVALISTFTSLISYGFSLIFAGFLAREIAQRIRVDYRAIGAAAYLGLGSVWALGLSSSAALLMATKSAIPATLLNITGVIPLSQTIYTWQSILVALLLIIVSIVVAWLTTPSGDLVRTAESFGIEPMIHTAESLKTPGEWLEFTPLIPIAIALIGFGYLGTVIVEKGWMQALELNTYNFLFLMAGLLLHWRVRSFSRAVTGAIPATAGIIIQFPFYAGIAGVITLSPIAKALADLFVKATTPGTYPILVSIYSAFLGLFVPSGGGKWVLEAPYVMQAAITQQTHLGWVVQIYNASEALPNLVNPFWMLPLLGILRMKARDLVGFGLIQLMVHTPLILLMMWWLAKTFTYVPPATGTP